MTTPPAGNWLTITSHAAGAEINAGEDIGGDIGYTWAFPYAAGLTLMVLTTNTVSNAANQTRAYINDESPTGTGGSWIATIPWPSGTNPGDGFLVEAALYDPSFTMLDLAQRFLIAGESQEEEQVEEEEEEAPYEGAEPGQEAPELALPWTTDMSFVMLYEQQNPVYQVVLPITPSELPESGDADVKQYRIIGSGQHSFPDGRSERKYTLTGYFPGGPRFDARLPHIHFDDWRPPQDLTSRLRDWVDRRTRLRYRSMGRAGRYDVPVYISHYVFTRQGHAGDIGFELDLTEWRMIRVRVDDGTDATEAIVEEDQSKDVDEPEEPNPVDYTVKPGDTLWFLAKEFLGDASRWPELYEANVDVIGDDPHWIYPGQTFRIPGGTVGTEEDDGYAPSGRDATEESE